MNFRKLYVVLIIISSMVVNGCSSMGILNSKSSAGEKVILSSKKVNLHNKSKVEKLLKHIKGSSYYKESKSSNEYGETVLVVQYGVNNGFGESDYINFWNDANKKEAIITNAVYLFLTVQDLDKVKIKLDAPIDEEFMINRNDVEAVYGMALENYEINEESLYDLLGGDDIEKIWCLVNS